MIDVVDRQRARRGEWAASRREWLRFSWLVAVLVGSLAWLSVAVPSSLAYTLTDSGQTKCYNDTAVIACPGKGAAFHGQDGNYRSPWPAFQDRGDGTVLDAVNGLIWMKGDDGQGRDLNTAKSYCAGLVYAGQSDWRLPSRRDMLGILDASRSDPAFSGAFVSQVLSWDGFWTSTQRAEYATDYWNIHSSTGGSFTDQTLFGSRALCVRGTATPGPSMSDNGDGTISDATTGLMWEKEGSASAMTWREALSWCQGRRAGGRADWRLPGKRELESLVDDTRIRPGVSPLFTESASPGRTYWSGTTSAGAAEQAWVCELGFNGEHYPRVKSSTNYARCVRGGLQTVAVHAPTALLIGEPAIPVVTLTSPDHSTTVQKGRQVTVTWTTHNTLPTDKMAVSMKRVSSTASAPDDQTWLRFTENAPNTGAYVATIPNGVASGDDWNFWVRHVPSGEADNSDEDISVLAAGETPVVRVTYPEEGVFRRAGEALTVRWETSGIPKNAAMDVFMERRSGGAAVQGGGRRAVATGVPNGGVYNVLLPLDLLAGDDWTATVRQSSGASSGSSGPVRVAAPGASRPLTLLYPNAATRLRKGDAVTVRWSTSGASASDKMVIVMKKTSLGSGQTESGKYHKFTDAAPNTGGYDLTIPESIEAGADWNFWVKNAATGDADNSDHDIVIMDEGFRAPDVGSKFYTDKNYNSSLASGKRLVGQCTWFMKGRLQETGLLPEKLALFTSGDAGAWYVNATKAYATGSTPYIGSDAIWTGGNHTAFVEGFLSDGTITTTESNDNPLAAAASYCANLLEQKLIVTAGDWSLYADKTGADVLETLRQFELLTPTCEVKDSRIKVTRDQTGTVGWVERTEASTSVTVIQISPRKKMRKAGVDAYIYPGPKLSKPANAAEVAASEDVVFEWPDVHESYVLQIATSSDYSGTNVVASCQPTRVGQAKDVDHTCGRTAEDGAYRFFSNDGFVRVTIPAAELPTGRYWWRVLLRPEAARTQWPGNTFTVK